MNNDKGYISFLVPVEALTKEQKFKLLWMDSQFDFEVIAYQGDGCICGYTFETDDYDIIKNYILNTLKIDSEYVYWSNDPLADDGVDLKKINTLISRKNKIKNIENL